MIQLFAIACLALLTCTTSFGRTPLSILGEPESLADDKAARQANLSYRVSFRPFHWAPAVMKVYITFDRPPQTGEARMRGRFVFVAIADGTDNKRFVRETALSHAQIVALLQCVQDQEIFHLNKPSLFTPEGFALPSDRGTDPAYWCFERYQSPSSPMPPVPPRYSVFWHVSCDHGPAQEVYSAFSKHALKLLPPSKLNDRKQ